MAQKETQFQTELVQAWNDVGAHCYKASHALMTGVADLSLRHLRLGAKIECKFIKPSMRTFRYCQVMLTHQQHSFLMRERKAGGVGIWIIGYVTKGGKGFEKHGLFVATPEPGKVLKITREMLTEDHPAHFPKTRSHPWPVGQISKFILDAEEGRKPYINV